jgi:hypothetical protein
MLAHVARSVRVERWMEIQRTFVQIWSSHGKQ